MARNDAAGGERGNRDGREEIEGGEGAYMEEATQWPGKMVQWLGKTGFSGDEGV